MASIINATTTAGVSVQGDNSGSLQLATNNGTTAVTIDASQNVGIGVTANSSNKLQVAGDIATSWATDKFIGMKFDTGTSYKMGLMLKDSSRECKVWSQSVDSDDKITFYTGSTPSERMRITSGGTVLLGTTSTSTFDGGFRANPTGTGGSMQVALSTTGGGTPFLLNTTADTNIINFYRSSTNVGTISVTTSSTAYNTSSDYRLKENIAPMTGALAKVAQLKPVTYTWKSTGETSQGFIAHELQAVVPDCVTGEKDAVDEEGNPVHQGIDTSFLVATLTSAIQELKAELDATKAEVQALKGTL